MAKQLEQALANREGLKTAEGVVASEIRDAITQVSKKTTKKTDLEEIEVNLQVNC